jgi:polyisoprenoid-binding protein YceI
MSSPEYPKMEAPAHWLHAVGAFCHCQRKGVSSVKTSIVSIVPAAIIAVSAVSAASSSPTLDSVKAGTYKIESYHTQVIFSVSHFGFTYYTGLLSGAAGSLRLDPIHPAASKLDVTIPLQSIMTTVPALTDQLKGAKWFDVTKYPEATFTSTNVTRGSNGDATVAGNLTLHGVTKATVLRARLVGAGVNPLDEMYTVGFQVSGTIKRSDFGMSLYAPALGDEVELSIAGAFELEN